MDFVTDVELPWRGNVTEYSPDVSEEHLSNMSFNGTFFCYQSDSPSSHYDRTMHERIEKFLMTKPLLAICVVGLVGNLLNLVILTRRGLESTMHELERCSHVGLVALSGSDFMFCLVVIPEAVFFSDKYMFRSNTFEMYFRIYGNGIINTFITCSTWLTLTVAVGRYLAICHPLRARYLLRLNFVRVQLVCVFVFSVLFNLPRYWFDTYLTLDCPEGGSQYILHPGALRKSDAKGQAFLWLYFIICILIPLGTLTVCNVKLVSTLKTSVKMQRAMSNETYHGGQLASQRITLTLVLILIFYLILISPADILFVAKEIIKSSYFRHYNLVAAIFHVMQASNFAVNFLLYCAVNSYFRRSLKEIFTCQSRAGNGANPFGRGEGILLSSRKTSRTNTKDTLLHDSLIMPLPRR